MRYNKTMDKRQDSNWEQKTDGFVDGVLEILLFPMHFFAIALPFAGIGSLISGEYRSGVLYLLGAIISYCIGRGIAKYFDYKKGFRH